MLASSVFGGSSTDSYLKPADQPEDPRNIISQAFVPHIAVHTSTDTRELIQDKGFSGGLWELLRPFGDRIQGKVTIRDSIGASKVWEDFGVRFVELGDGLEPPDESEGTGEGRPGSNGAGAPSGIDITQRATRTGGDIAKIEELVDRHLAYAETFGNGNTAGSDLEDAELLQVDPTSPFYTLYLRRLLSGIPLAPHETFSHPVACVIAISSRNKNPIESLKALYDESTRGEKRVPIWVNNDYLRYYILVHDEERDDITASIALFDKMKRSFGLHCHLLRLRSTQCVATDDDAVQLPRSDWLSASEELSEIERLEDIDDSSPYIYESDTTAIKTFIREMVTQSVVPSMERCVALWNDQVASKRRGISGRLINMSKKWPFGSGRSSGAGGYGGASGSNSNYDPLHGFYRPDSPEAIMRKLADYSFMLRDYKLAQSIYDLLRSDFNNDKAWKYHAAVNEMAAISQLLLPQSMSSRVRAETVDQMLETASYSYMTRCSASYGTLRSLVFGMELLRLRGGSAVDDAARWGVRVLEAKVVGAVGDALFKERIAACYSTKKGTGSGAWGSRTRKSALWSILASDSWLVLDKPKQSKQRLDEAMRKYAGLPYKDSISRFSLANGFIQGLRRDLDATLEPLVNLDETPDGDHNIETTIDEETQAFDEKRSHRRSLMGAMAPPLSTLESAPLHSVMLDEESASAKVDNFESG